MIAMQIVSIFNTYDLAIELVYKSSLTLLVAFTFHLMFCKRWPLAVSTAWNASLVAIVILPFMMFLPPVQVDYTADLPLTSTGSQKTTNPQSQPFMVDAFTKKMPEKQPLESTSLAVPTVHPLTPVLTPVATSLSVSIEYIIAFIYLCGVCLVGMRLVFGLHNLFQLKRKAEAITLSQWNTELVHWKAELGICCRVQLYHSSAVKIPFVWGLWRPVVMLPSELYQRATHKERTVILLHELTHIARFDSAWHWLLRSLQVLFWWQPLLWFASRQIGEVRERVCDQFCVGTLGDREQYIDVLLRIAEKVTRPVELGIGLAMVRVPRISKRLHEIATGSELKHYRPTKFVSIILLSAIVFGTGIMGQVSKMWLQNQQRILKRNHQRILTVTFKVIRCPAVLLLD